MPSPEAAAQQPLRRARNAVDVADPRASAASSLPPATRPPGHQDLHFDAAGSRREQGVVSLGAHSALNRRVFAAGDETGPPVVCVAAGRARSPRVYATVATGGSTTGGFRLSSSSAAAPGGRRVIAGAGDRRRPRVLSRHQRRRTRHRTRRLGRCGAVAACGQSGRRRGMNCSARARPTGANPMKAPLRSTDSPSAVEGSAGVAARSWWPDLPDSEDGVWTGFLRTLKARGLGRVAAGDSRASPGCATDRATPSFVPASPPALASVARTGESARPAPLSNRR